MKKITFYQFPMELLEANISPTAKITYMIMYNINQLSKDGIQIKQKTLAAKLGVKERRIRIIINELQKAGLITKIERYGNEINKYYINIPFTKLIDEKPKGKKKKDREEQSYDINEIEKYAINYEEFSKVENQD